MAEPEKLSRDSNLIIEPVMEFSALPERRVKPLLPIRGEPQDDCWHYRWLLLGSHSIPTGRRGPSANLFGVGMLGVGALGRAREECGTILRFLVDPADIFSDHADRNQLDAAK